MIGRKALQLMMVAVTISVPAAVGAPTAHQPAWGAASADARWQWPVSPHPVLRGFEPPPTPYAAGHRGLDLAAEVGQPVTAVEAGLVTHAGPVAGRGSVTVRHFDGLESTYEPLDASVQAGDLAAAGQQLGTVQQVLGHCGARSCLHLGARVGDSYLDPLPLLGRERVVLLPLLP